MIDPLPAQVVTEDCFCPLQCKAGDDVVLYGFDRLHHLPGKFAVVRCRTCGLMRTNPRPTAGTIGYYYPEDYGPYLGTQVHDLEPESRLRAILKSIYKQLVRFNSNNIPKMKPGKFLEIGCASGSFMHRMAQTGWEVSGIEFSERAAGHAQHLGYSVHIGAIENIAMPYNARFDLIAGWMVLEHLHDPVSALIKLHGWAATDGYLVLSVPNAAAKEFSWFRDRWYALQLPTHLYHFTPATLKRVLETAGWRIDKIFHQRLLINLVSSLEYLLEDKYPQSGLAKKVAGFQKWGVKANLILYPLAYALSLIGQTGRMTVWAREID